MRAVHFGAGNIGRGFIGQLLSDSGYEVCFVTRNERIVSLLQQKQRYKVTLANETRDTSIVRNVNAINIRNKKQVEEAVASADLITTAVGVAALKDIAIPIAAGILLRLKRKQSQPLHVIACENAIGGSSLLKEKVYALLPKELRERAGHYVAFPDAAVDRIVPVQKHEDPLQVTVEPFFEWVVDRSAMIDTLHDINGVQFVDKLEPFIERKLFTVNTGHCCAAYHGYLEGYETIQEALSDTRLRMEVQRVLQETGDVLAAKYKWDRRKHEKYIRKIMERLKNPKLTDSIVRVARSPIRKLSFGDRLVRPAIQAYNYGLSAKHLTSAMGAALLFDYSDDSEAIELQAAIADRGIEKVISEYMGIPAKHPLHHKISERYKEMKRGLQIQA